MDKATILVDRRGRVGVITLNRPDVLNALNAAILRDVVAAVGEFEADREVSCLVLTGSDRAFAAGADIGEMAGLGYPDTYLDDLFALWDRFASRRKPAIAAVSGFALGGGCELALMCDIILASETAQFGLPEIKLGVMPGIGGTQRLTRAIGKAKAMEMCLTGRLMGATEAERAGLVSRIVPPTELLSEAFKVADTIAAMSLPATLMVKEAVDRSQETSLAEGVRFERRIFQAIFATLDQKEGMAAFSAKRSASFQHR